MCGFIASTVPVDKKLLSNSLESIKHRGPDFVSDVVSVGTGFMGHARLSIIGLNDSANQPYNDLELGLTIVFNGEIYNYKELAKQFNIELKTNSDTELLIKLYCLLGEKCLLLLNGMFSFVLYNDVKKTWFVARDRLGVKPLYWISYNGGYVFASEVVALLTIGGDAVSSFDTKSIEQYRAFRAPLGTRTLYKGINKFPAAHYFINDSFNCYWKLDQKFENPPADEELTEMLSSAISSRLVSDVPVGALVSGGLDSCFVASMSGVADAWVGGFQGDQDIDYASRFCLERNMSLRKVILNEESFLSEAESYIKQSKLPLGVPNEVVLSLIAKSARANNIKVLLCGEGADELFAGYNRIFDWSYALSVASKKMCLDQFAQYYAYKKNVNQEDIYEALAPYQYLRNPYLIISAYMQISHLSVLLTRLDMATMRFGVEAREPFCDFRLVERLFGLPFEYKCAQNNPKTPLKRVSQSVLPSYIIEREKVGFPIPLHKLFPESVFFK